MQRKAPAPAVAPALALALALALVLPGCAAPEPADPEVARLAASAPRMSWAPGNYWAYRATFQNGASIDVALVVHGETPDGFRLGSNKSAGFFGLPFNGNVSKDLNPRVAGEEWPLFRSPLADGATWSYHMFGHDATTTARAAMVALPDGGEAPGYRFESKAYGQTFARYEYAPSVGWFTRLELIEPTNGTVVLDVRLLAYGEDFGEAYFVERTVRQIRIDYPTVPGAITIQVPHDLEHVRALVSVQAEAGVLEATLNGARGEPLASARAVGKQTSTDRASVRGGSSMTWTLEHVGTGVGFVYVEITGLSATGKLSRLDGPPESYSTRPARPQLGQDTLTGSPVAVYGISVPH